MGVKKSGKTAVVVPMERITQTILLRRGHKVILDDDLAALYKVKTKTLNRAVKRNRSVSGRFHVPAYHRGVRQLEVPIWHLKFEVTLAPQDRAADATRLTSSRSRAWPCTPAFCTATVPSTSTSRSCAPSCAYGTTAWMHDSMDGGGRTASGTAVEEVEPRRRPTWMWEGRATQGAVAGNSGREQRREQLSGISGREQRRSSCRDLASNVQLSRKLATLERKYNAQFKVVFDAIKE